MPYSIAFFRLQSIPLITGLYGSSPVDPVGYLDNKENRHNNDEYDETDDNGHIFLSRKEGGQRGLHP